MLEIKKLILLFILLLFPFSAHAANHYVRQGAVGNGSGSDWTNAYTTLPASLTRGDTYYVADGSYPSHVFTDSCTVSSARCVDGTAVITIKKAIPSDHGTDTGWNAGTMGSSQASFPGGFASGTRTTGFITIDGQTSSPYGFLVPIVDGGRGFDWATGAVHVILQYIDFSGPSTGSGYNFTTETRSIDATVPNGDPTDWLLVSHCDIHGTDTLIQTTNCANCTIEYSRLYDDLTLNLALHPNLWWDGGSTNGTYRYNESWNTAAEGIFWTVAGGTPGTGVTGPQAGWRAYGNIFRDLVSTGVAIQARGGFTYAGSFLIYNNTFANGTATGFVTINCSDGCAVISGWQVKNNIFWNGSVGFSAGQSGLVHDYNWTSGTTMSEANGIFSGSNPFTNLAGKDFTLASASSPIDHGVNLSSPYDVDVNGNTRGSDGTWDIGAFEYCPFGCYGGGGGTTGRTFTNRTFPSGGFGTRGYGTRTFP